MIPVSLLAWAAGFFDGEGCFHIAYTQNEKRYPQVSVSQSGVLGHELLLKFDRAVGKIGTLYGPKLPGRNQTLCRWQWEASGITKVEQVYLTLRPFLGTTKREQAARVITAYYQDRR